MRFRSFIPLSRVHLFPVVFISAVSAGTAFAFSYPFPILSIPQSYFSVLSETIRPSRQLQSSFGYATMVSTSPPSNRRTHRTASMRPPSRDKSKQKQKLAYMVGLARTRSLPDINALDQQTRTALSDILQPQPAVSSSMHSRLIPRPAIHVVQPAQMTAVARTQISGIFAAPSASRQGSSVASASSAAPTKYRMTSASAAKEKEKSKEQKKTPFTLGNTGNLVYKRNCSEFQTTDRVLPFSCVSSDAPTTSDAAKCHSTI